jgi:2-polyprenyl-3-methyl-5-hydroxy-6-metoxy-1,4-benzoquinol methylase
MGLRKFINFNVRVSNYIESFFTPHDKDCSNILLEFFDMFNKGSKIADVGGGKKPAKATLKRERMQVKCYDGFDIDLNELDLAKRYYTNISKVDLTESLPSNIAAKYDFIVCRNTLEHVDDVRASVENLAGMLVKGGKLYLKLPCRHALFAKLNLALPQGFKKKVLHFIYPHKAGDGFRVYYDKSTPAELSKILGENGLDIEKLRLNKYSSYFAFFFPFYFIWRIVSCVQNRLVDDYCESFEVVAKKL